MNKDSRILITGANGMVGRYLQFELERKGYWNIISPKDVDLRDSCSVNVFFKHIKPEYVFHLAARVGGVHYNKEVPAEFFYDNVMINTNVIEGARMSGVKKLLFCGTAAMYPKDCIQPMKEEYLMTGKMHESNLSYTFAKLAGILMCQAYRQQYGCNFISCLPTNIYGMYDNFNLERAHVVPSMIHRFYNVIKIDSPFIIGFGSGGAKREFLYAEDFANAMIFLMNNYDLPEPINIGGENVSIQGLIESIKKITGFKGDIIWNTEFPEGVKERVLDSTKIKNLGWSPKISFEEGLKITYNWFYNFYDNARK